MRDTPKRCFLLASLLLLAGCGLQASPAPTDESILCAPFGGVKGALYRSETTTPARHTQDIYVDCKDGSSVSRRITRSL